MRRFVFALAALLDARAGEKDARVAALAQADAKRRDHEREAASLRERQARLRAAIGAHARTAPPDTLRSAFLLIEAFDAAIVSADQRQVQAAVLVAAEAARAREATAAWKRIELFERRSFDAYATQMRIADERELDEANLLAPRRLTAR